jgi:hypothetical protein
MGLREWLRGSPEDDVELSLRQGADHPSEIIGSPEPAIGDFSGLGGSTVDRLIEQRLKDLAETHDERRKQAMAPGLGSSMLERSSEEPR